MHRYIPGASERQKKNVPRASVVAAGVEHERLLVLEPRGDD